LLSQEISMNKHESRRYDLVELANLAMVARGLEPEFSEGVLRELKAITGAAVEKTTDLPDLTQRLWCSIDNDDSMDLDQITFAEKIPEGGAKVVVAVADVDALVKIGQPIDLHAKKNTTSVYTGVKLFPMLPEKLSTDLTSLSEGSIRIALIIEMVISESGEIVDSKVYRGMVKNHVKLAYNSISEWLDGAGPMPDAVAKVKGMDEQLQLQNKYAQKMRALRHEHGALELATIEPRPVLADGIVIDLKDEPKNTARDLIEDLMIGANGVTARYLVKAGYATFRRVVRSPERWERIMEVAANIGEKLPAVPSSRALGEFLSRRKIADPLRFPDLSLTVVKLLGRGEYIVEMPGEDPIGHFGLAVRDYAHSTAPNRRYPDLITHRLLKAALKKLSSPYGDDELRFLASHCTVQENAADKVERQVRKSAAALLLSGKIGQHFDGIVTGASSKGTWARVFKPPVEGRISQGQHGLDVGDRVRVKLVSVDVDRGYIDFERAPQ
jgi:exoribonuclease-2